jgi:RAB protein geranylgeranyltransferase component A
MNLDRVSVTLLGASLHQCFFAYSLSKKGRNVLLVNSDDHYPADLVACARPLFSTEPLLQELIQMGMQDYFSFQSIQSLHIAYEKNKLNDAFQFQKIPYCKEHVFLDPTFSLVEKRLLMKTLAAMQQSIESSQGQEHDTLSSYLKDQLKLPCRLQDIILFGIVQALDPQSTVSNLYEIC